MRDELIERVAMALYEDWADQYGRAKIDWSRYRPGAAWISQATIAVDVIALSYQSVTGPKENAAN